MGENDDETKFCINCEKHISLANYLIHNMHCQRNIILCKDCKKPIPKNDIEVHNQEMHSEVICDKCSKIIESWRLDEHKTTCIKRIMQCCYCELECSLDEMKDHESYCGSRTEICPLCKQYIMLKNKKDHESKCCLTEQLFNSKTMTSDNYGMSFPCEFCDNLLPDMSLMQHQCSCEGFDLSTKNISEIEKSHIYPDRIPCEFCGDLFPEEFLLEHQTFCTSENVQGSDILADNIYLTETDQNYPECIPCEFCGHIFPMEYFIQHQAICNDNNLEQILSDEFYPVDKYISHPSSIIMSNQSTKHQENSELEALSVIDANNLKSSTDAKEFNLKSLQSSDVKIAPKKVISKNENTITNKKLHISSTEAAKSKEFFNIDSYFQRWDRKHSFNKDITCHFPKSKTGQERSFYHKSSSQKEYNSYIHRKPYNDKKIDLSGACPKYLLEENQSDALKTKLNSPIDSEITSNSKRNLTTFNPLLNSVSTSQHIRNERIFEIPTRRSYILHSFSPDEGNSKNKCTKNKVKTSRSDDGV